MECLDRRAKDRRHRKRYFTIEKIVLLLIVTAGIGAAHTIGWNAHQEVGVLKAELTSIAELQHEIHPNDVDAFIEHLRICPHAHHEVGESCPEGHTHIKDSREAIEKAHPDLGPYLMEGKSKVWHSHNMEIDPKMQP